jgi:protein ImuB
MLWLGIFLPRLPIEVFLRGLPEPSPGVTEPALAVCDRLHVLLTNKAAQSQGIEAGMKRATALALAARLELLERNLQAEREALRQLAIWALQFTPGVSVQGELPTLDTDCIPASTAGRHRSKRKATGVDTGPSGLLLEIEPSLKLFGGLDTLLERISRELDNLGFSAQISCAPTATAAWLLARSDEGRLARNLAQMNANLARLPISTLDSAAPHLEKFEAIGISRFTELLQLPRAGVARRFGSELLLEIDRALGKQPDPRRWFEAPDQFYTQIELFAQVENAQNLWLSARRLLLQLVAWLGARHAAASQVQIYAEHDDHPPTPIMLRLAEPSRDPDRFLELLRETLAITKLAAPAHTLQLHCDQIVSLAASNTELFPMPATMRESLNRLIERLAARLGHDQVQRLMLVQDHRPEFAYRIEPQGLTGHRTLSKRAGKSLDQPPGQTSGKSTRKTRNQAKENPTDVLNPLSAASPASLQVPAEPLQNTTLPRPLWLLKQPIPLSERNNRPYWHGALQLVAGPERIESGWWDNALIQRDYFIASDESAALLWIYRERMPDAKRRQGWFLQGRFG